MTLNVPHWQDNRACLGISTDLFYLDSSEAVEVNRQLRPICEGCPVLQDCRDWARHHEEHGFWAGESAAARKKWRRENGVDIERVTVPSAWLAIEKGVAA
jgi:WhiB family redox-sensing transcriptional regulator